MNLKSRKIALAKSKEALYGELNEPESFRRLMPDEVQLFKAGEDFTIPWFSFMIGGMPEIKLVRHTAEPYCKVEYETPIGAKIRLGFEIDENGEGGCLLTMYIFADVNPFLSTMVEKPLRRFIDDFTSKII